MNLSEHITVANRFQGPKPEPTLATAAAPTRATAQFGRTLTRRLAEARRQVKAAEQPAPRNPSVLCS